MQKSFALALIVATVVQAAPGRGGRKRQDKKRYQDTAFNGFLSKFNKNIVSTAEFETRQECYHKADARINKQNAKSLPGDPIALRYKHDIFSDMTPEEYEKYLGLNQEIEHFEHKQGIPQHRPGRHLEDIPQAINWATTDNPMNAVKMGPVKNQGSCGSCWAFAVTTTLEGTLAIKSDSAPIRISEQQGVDCTLAHSQGGSYNDDDWGCWGCEGCWMSNHYRYLKRNGAMLNSDYPYEAKQLGNCDQYDANKIVGKVQDYYVIQTVDEMKERAAKQPLDVAVCANGWSGIGTGIMKREDCCEGLNHAVTIVGYNLCGEDEGGDNEEEEEEQDDNTPDPTPTPTGCEVDKWWYSCEDTAARRLQQQCVPYWIVQNSWGTWWGDNGFIKLEISDDTIGTCGVHKVAEYSEWANLY